MLLITKHTLIPCLVVTVRLSGSAAVLGGKEHICLVEILKLINLFSQKRWICGEYSVN